jgi:hypothetical protein
MWERVHFLLDVLSHAYCTFEASQPATTLITHTTQKQWWKTPIKEKINEKNHCNQNRTQEYIHASLFFIYNLAIYEFQIITEKSLATNWHWPQFSKIYLLPIPISLLHFSFVHLLYSFIFTIMLDLKTIILHTKNHLPLPLCAPFTVICIIQF